MAVVLAEHARTCYYMPDLGYVTFVAKLQKAKTRKDKDYFILRVTVPKAVAKKMDVESGGFLFFKAKKAKWYHMLDWTKMENTWQMLPEGIKRQAILEGLPCPGTEIQARALEMLQAWGATSPSGSVEYMPQMETQTSQRIE